MAELKRVRVRFEREVAGVPVGTVRLLPLTPEVLYCLNNGHFSEVKSTEKEDAEPKAAPKAKTTGKKQR